MTATTFDDAGTASPRPRNLARIYALETKYELLKQLRLPAYSLPTIAFPALFYALFTVTYGSHQVGGIRAAAYMPATYGVFGVIGAALFGFGVGVAVERGQGWLLLKRASPMPTGAYFAAKCAMSLAFGTIIVALLSVLGAILAGLRLPAGEWLALALVQVSGAVPFCALGLAFGTWCGPSSAPAVVNLVYLPMSLASGLWMPLPSLPAFLRHLAPWMPPYHLAQLALKVVGGDAGQPVWLHVGALVLVTAVSLALARAGLRRDADKTYG